MVLPDPVCTPGAANPAVSQANIASTVCSSGWTATIRPAESYTENLKRQEMAAYGDTGSISGYEEDHLIALELGGSPTDPTNLWPEPGASPNPKDKVEDAARAAVCSGRITLAAAQRGIASNWITFGQQLGVLTTGPAVTPAVSSPAAAATTTPVAPAPVVATPASPAASATSCTTAASGNCYKAGQFCPTSYHNHSGTDAEGNPITCKQDSKGAWQWAH